MSNNIIAAKGITKSYGKQSILRGIDLQVEQGTIFAVLGPNGAGKTTMVRILSTLTKLDSGEVMVAGHELHREMKAIRADISLTGQYAAVDEKLSGIENMLMIGELCGLRRKEAKKRALRLLGQFDLLEDANKISGTYSGGMRRKLDLAMSLINAPKIIFLDEPTTGLDPRSRKAMWEIINGLRQNGVTIFLTTQYLEEADQLADKVIVIDNGVVAAEGTPDDLKQRVGDRSLQLTFENATTAQTAATLFHADEVFPSVSDTSISIKTDGSVTHTRQVLDKLANAHIEPIDMAFHKPSLDEVFFALTGNTQKEEDTNHEK